MSPASAPPSMRWSIVARRPRADSPPASAEALARSARPTWRRPHASDREFSSRPPRERPDFDVDSRRCHRPDYYRTVSIARLRGDCLRPGTLFSCYGRLACTRGAHFPAVKKEPWNHGIGRQGHFGSGGSASPALHSRRSGGDGRGGRNGGGRARRTDRGGAGSDVAEGNSTRGPEEGAAAHLVSRRVRRY